MSASTAARTRPRSDRAAAPAEPACNAAARASLLRELRDALLLALLSGALFSLIFPELSIWPLAFLCLTPWAVAVRLTRRRGVILAVSFVVGFLFFLINLRWLMPVTGLGFVALALYLAVYWPLAAVALRSGRRAGIPMAWSLPVAWVACEWLRAWVMTGFPWLFLSHALWRQIPLIQISDLTGAYGVSFLAAMVNGLLADYICARVQPAFEISDSPGMARRRAMHRLLPTTVAAAALAAGALAYGLYRSGQTGFRDGPRVAVVQEDFPLVSEPPYGAPYPVVLARYLAEGARAAAQRPDLVVFPETVWGATQNRSFVELPRDAINNAHLAAWNFGQQCDQALSAFARGDYAAVNRIIEHYERVLEGRVEPRYQPFPRLPPEGGPAQPVLLGAVSMDYRANDPARARRFNSALFYDADGRQRAERYDKMHLVPFGEVVPFRNARFLGIDLHPLYEWLNRLSPFSADGSIDYSLHAGSSPSVFTHSYNGGTARFGVPICYEDVMPDVARAFVWDKGRRRADYLINISNDGWFLHSDELVQHLAICVFRAVENRVAIARAVNTGVSGFIDPNGRCFGLVERQGRLVGPGIVGASVQTVPLDDRPSLYGRIGDAFAGLCLAAALLLWLRSPMRNLLRRILRRSQMQEIGA